MRIATALSILGLAAAAFAQSAPMRTYKDPGLQMTFSYPAELTPAGGETGSGCSRVLLKAALGTNPNENAAGAGSAAGSERWATLTVSDLGPGCFPAKVLKKTKMLYQMLSGLAGDPTQVLGLSPLEQPMGYLMQGHHAFLAAAQGEPVSGNGLQPANGSEVLAVVAASVGDHVLTWRMESNDMNLLNRILASQVDFGSGAPQPLYPGHLGE